MKKELLDTIDSYSKLEKGWNAGNGIPIPQEVIENTKKLIKKLKIEPEIFPTGRGSINCEFSNSIGEELEVEIFTNRAGYLIDNNGPMIAWEEKYNVHKAISYIEDFLKKKK